MSNSKLGFFSNSPSGPDESSLVPKLEGEIRRLKSAVEELTVLNDLAIAASTTFELDKLLNIIVQKSVKAIKAEQGSIMLVTEQKDAPLKTLIRQADQRSKFFAYKVGINIHGWVLKNQQPLMIENLATDPRFRTTEQERKEIRSLLCVPIRYQAQLLGLLTVINKKSSESFTSDDLRLLSILASQSGQLIRNSELQEETVEKKKMDQELLVARKIQMDLLPQQRPEFKNLQIAAYLNPADQVGGDYYDYFPLDENRIGMVLADVSGHGPSAALVMTMVKGILHSITQKFDSPASVLAEMNSILYRIAPKEIFVTMAILLFDRDKMLLKYSNAGHNPILFYDEQTHTCQPVSLPGPALGISPRSNFNEKIIPLHTGDGFLIYTDGITESCNQEGEMFEEKRLIQMFEEVVTKPADIIIQHITSGLNAFTHQAPQADDVAMITTKVV